MQLAASLSKVGQLTGTPLPPRTRQILLAAEASAAV